jgi:hypothetical protein
MLSLGSMYRARRHWGGLRERFSGQATTMHKEHAATSRATSLGVRMTGILQSVIVGVTQVMLAYMFGLVVESCVDLAYNGDRNNDCISSSIGAGNPGGNKSGPIPGITAVHNSDNNVRYGLNTQPTHHTYHKPNPLVHNSAYQSHTSHITFRRLRRPRSPKWKPHQPYCLANDHNTAGVALDLDG